MVRGKKIKRKIEEKSMKKKNGIVIMTLSAVGMLLSFAACGTSSGGQREKSKEKSGNLVSCSIKLCGSRRTKEK